MSKARSPRDVCSTIMGTSGLMVLASFSVVRVVPACWGSLAIGQLPSPWAVGRFEDRLRPLRPGGPEACGGVLGGRLLLGRPQLVASLGLLDGYRSRLAGQEVDRRALGEVLAKVVQAPRLLQPGAQLLGGGALARRGGLEGVEHVAVGRLDLLGL